MSTIDKYIVLITQFVSGEITASQFEASYLEMFKNETETLPEDIFNVLNSLFSDVDAYCGDSDLREDGDLTEEELLACAKKALKTLINE